jgi:formylglycine-generating enzyme required for sulfatase activity
LSRFDVTFAQWDACAAAGGCRRRPDDAGWGRGWQPVINVSWDDAQQYVAWLSRKTGRGYRLLSEAEWEYAARAGSHARFWWGNSASRGEADCNDCGSAWDGQRPAPVGRFGANPFGLYDMHGNVAEWVQDCYRGGYRGAPTDGTPRPDCSSDDERIVRGGAWDDDSGAARAAARDSAAADHYDNRTGFRVARSE